LLYRVIETLRLFDVAYQGVDHSVKSRLTGVVIADREGLEYVYSVSDLNNAKIVNIDANNVEGAVVKAVVMSKLESNKVYALVAGIDYGKSIGVAIVVDSVVIYMKRHRSEREVIKIVKLFFNNVEAVKKLVRIGIPTPMIHKSFELFVDMLNKELPQGVVVELVSEYSTSKSIAYEEMRLDEDSFAALNIAMKSHKAYE
jgi:phage-related holin